MRTMMAALLCTVTMAASAHAAIREEPVTCLLYTSDAADE